MTMTKGKRSWSTILSRGLFFSLIWWIITGGDASSWWIGLPAVLLALSASTLMVAPSHLIWYEVLRFAPFFLLRSLSGGADVAWRAFHPGMPIAPDLVDYPLRLPPGLPQAVMANIVSLLPGTLSATLEGDVLKVHMLDSRKNSFSELNKVERGVARMFGLSPEIIAEGE